MLMPDRNEFIPFGEWKPDLPKYMRNGAIDANNVIPFLDGYKPLKGLSQRTTSGLNAECTGAASFISSTGAVVTFAGTETKLYKVNGESMEDVTWAGGPYNGAGQVWRFVQWGDYVFATNYNDPIQKFQIGTDTQFSLMSASAPRAKEIAVVNSFLVAGNTLDTSDGVVENRIWWSPIADPFGTWATSQTTLSGFADLEDGGYVVGIAGGEYGSILMRNSIYRFDFTGGISPPFQLKNVEPKRGCISIDAFTQDGRIVYFLAPDGFYVFDGNSSQPIGANKVDNTFWDSVKKTAYNRIFCGRDQINKLIVWGYPDTSSTTNTPNKWLIYNYTTGWWSEATFLDTETTINRFMQLYTEGYNLDQTYNTADILLDSTTSPDLDDPFWKGGLPVFGGFGGDGNNLYYFNGTNRDGTLTTQDVQFVKDRRSFVKELRLIGEVGSGHVCEIEGRQDLQDTATTRGSIQSNDIGRFCLRSSSRYHRFIFTLKNNWTHAKGCEVVYNPEGRR